MERLHDLIELGKELSVLYVEDDENLRLETNKILERIFDNVDVSCNGEEGLESFQKNNYDLVITDVEMPKINGIEMSKSIRLINNEVPIVIISAYSSSNYFIDAISIGISYYILKPINMPHLVDTLYAATKNIIDKQLAHQYRLNEITKKVQKASQSVLSEITNISPNPTIVYNQESISFMNQAFKELFEEEDLKQLLENEEYLLNFLNEKISIDSVVHTENDFIEQLDKFNNDTGKYKVSLRTKNGRKIFLVFRKSLDIEGSTQSIVYTFNDITVVEYQKVQINQYNEYMNELMYSKYKLNEAEGQAEIINKTSF